MVDSVGGAQMSPHSTIIVLDELEVRRQIRAPKIVASHGNSTLNRVALLPHI